MHSLGSLDQLATRVTGLTLLSLTSSVCKEKFLEAPKAVPSWNKVIQTFSLVGWLKYRRLDMFRPNKKPPINGGKGRSNLDHYL
jgi:hypothetical protein